MAAVPYKDSGRSKKAQVEEMFDSISHRYDFLNHLLSLNIDKVWRKKAIRLLEPFQPKTILDIATGTGDFAIAAKRLNPEKVVGVDLSEGMLNIGREKLKRKGLDQLIQLQKGDSENLTFENDSFDAAIVAFGVRNFENLEKGLTEINRVVKPGGVFIVLEFSQPRKAPFKQLYFFYFDRILPLLGKAVSKDNRAYTYLPESVREFPDGDSFISVLEKTGFDKCRWLPQTFGIASIYEAQKPES
jgi:demethylmenaquinone methyltransferase/2-methoxy-6-polyprenyl-1,4-benzoquinol methylase